MSAEPIVMSRRIFLVEDHADTADAMALLLRRMGHSVTVARTFAEARALCCDGGAEYDVALCDVTLPDGDGRELVRPIKSSHRNIKVIALTGHGMPEEVQSLASAGFDALLLKPITAEALFDLLA